MGTGVAPPVWSPGKSPGGGQARPGAGPGGLVTPGQGPGGKSARASRVGTWHVPRDPSVACRPGGPPGVVTALRVRETCVLSTAGPGPASRRGSGRGGQALGCWDRSAAAVARRPRPAHRPGRLPGAFRARALGNLVLGGASRLDAFSAYPGPTWLTGRAPGGAGGPPEGRPPPSSRTWGA